MLNYWTITRPRRSLNGIVAELAECSRVVIGRQWNGEIETQLVQRSFNTFTIN